MEFQSVEQRSLEPLAQYKSITFASAASAVGRVGGVAKDVLYAIKSAILAIKSVETKVHTRMRR